MPRDDGEPGDRLRRCEDRHFLGGTRGRVLEFRFRDSVCRLWAKDLGMKLQEVA